MKRIKLTASRWHQKVEDGYIHRRAGEVIEVPDRDADRLIRANAAVASRAKLTDPDEAKTEAPDPNPEPAPTVVPEATDPEPVEAEDVVIVEATDAEAPEVVEKPAATDSTDAWRAYAISQGMTEDEANNLNRTELRKHYS